MQNKLTTCRLCFPTGEVPQQRVFGSSGAAILAFGTLFEAGRMPSMCEGEDRNFRVCHQSCAQSSSAPIALPGRRLAVLA